MKTLRYLVKDKGEVRRRKVSLPAQRYQPDQSEVLKDGRKGSLWQNVKKKISFSVSTEESLKTPSEIEELKEKSTTASKDEQNNEVGELPRIRRVNSDVGEEDVMNFAIIEGDIRLLKSILDSSTININYLRPPGTTPLHQACIEGNLDIVELLVRRGANIHLRDHRDLSPLQLANLYGHFEIAEFLIRIGSPVTDIRDGFQIDRRRRRKQWCFKVGMRGSAYEPVDKDNCE